MAPAGTASAAGRAPITGIQYIAYPDVAPAARWLSVERRSSQGDRDTATTIICTQVTDWSPNDTSYNVLAIYDLINRLVEAIPIGSNVPLAQDGEWSVTPDQRATGWRPQRTGRWF